jgi:hypothetical protein
MRDAEHGIAAEHEFEKVEVEAATLCDQLVMNFFVRRQGTRYSRVTGDALNVRSVIPLPWASPVECFTHHVLQPCSDLR